LNAQAARVYPDLSYFDPVLMLCAAPHVFALSLRQALISALYAGAGTVPPTQRKAQAVHRFFQATM
jgi:hypothetical protein